MTQSHGLFKYRVMNHTMDLIFMKLKLYSITNSVFNHNKNPNLNSIFQRSLFVCFYQSNWQKQQNEHQCTLQITPWHIKWNLRKISETIFGVLIKGRLRCCLSHLIFWYKSTGHLNQNKYETFVMWYNFGDFVVFKRYMLGGIFWKLSCYIFNMCIAKTFKSDAHGKLPTNIQTHRSILASINFLRPDKPGLEPKTHGFKDKHANE